MSDQHGKPGWLDLIGILFLLCMLALSAFGLTRIRSNTEDVLQWLPDQSAARDDYNFFSRHFQSDDFVLVTWTDCRLGDSRLATLANAIQELDQDGLILQVATGDAAIRRLRSELNLTRRSALRRLRGILVGTEDSERTCALISFTREGTRRRADTVQLIENAVLQVPGLDRSDVSLAGYPYLATYIDLQLKNSYVTLLLPSILLATIIALACLRDLRLGIIVFVAASGAATASVAIVPATGHMLGGLMSIIPALVFVLTISGAVHLIRYGLEVEGNPWKLLAIGWRPCLISTLTTAVGMLSLMRSDFPAIRNFGCFCAVGVGLALAFQLILVPWLLSRMGRPGLNRMQQRRAASTLWIRLGSWLRTRSLWLSALFLLLIAMGIVGLGRLRAQVEIETLFRSDSEMIRSLRVLETQLSPLDQSEVLLVFEHPDRSRVYQRLAFVRAIQSELNQLERIGVAYSGLNFLPREPDPRSAREAIQRSLIRDWLDQNLERLAAEDWLAQDPETNREIWRITLRVPFTEAADFDGIRAEVVELIERTSARVAATSEVQPPTPVFSGHTYLFHHAQSTLLQDLFRNFLLAFAIIGPLLMLVLRSFRLGLLAMFPNVFPTVIVFGGLGWIDFPIDLALAMTASVALGIAVDDTTHFLIRFRDFGGRWGQVAQPIQMTLGQCGPAMLFTTLIASASLLTFCLSEMQVVSRFAWAISLLLAVAVIADLLFLPAMLYLCGHWFSSEPPRQASK